MAYSEPDPELCKKYAQFASHMVRWQFKVIYWTMFIANLFVLFLASWSFTKAQTAADRLKDNPKKRSKTIRMYMLLCLGCIVVSTVIVVMEVYSLMALQFCDGEDLISLYWSSFMMIQVGSLIAMIGIILSMIHQLRNSAHPPWALALGTPVLVIAGFLHLFHLGTKTKIKKMRAASTSTASSGDPNAGPPISQVYAVAVPVLRALLHLVHVG
ncbi:hypothetical protein GMORB2_2618 [Geosmithia morbida]|uniref:Uncharacterized protein n=1 Tax=Geosmithia morbida TaxID=1094350 RepID=A0A9P4YQ00_9HYPO|nr:uncharacterized protein GMORB2_2618 [Geosmithia morbida]KAF4120615.1 hypothetical protein GMORB2_2618 [Geosmithia morbida]